MYDLGRLWTTAGPGLRDLARTLCLPAHRTTTATVTPRLWGRAPVAAFVALAAICVAAGLALQSAPIDLPFFDAIHWPALLFAAACAWRVRTKLVEDSTPLRELDVASRDLFRAVARPIALGAVVLVLLEVLVELLLFPGPASRANDGLVSYLHTGAVVVEHLLRYGTAVAILLAVFVHCREWFGALFTLFLVYFVFRLTVGFSQWLVLEIAPLSRLSTFLLGLLLSRTLPTEVQRLIDLLALTVFMSSIYLAVIGSVWMVSQRAFERLLANGEVDILAELRAETEEKEEARGEDAGGEDAGEEEVNPRPGDPGTG